MARKRTWHVLEMGIEPVDEIELSCPNCDYVAHMPIADTSANHIIAAFGLSLIFDYPGRPFPNGGPIPVTVRCRRCRHEFTRKAEEQVTA